MKRLAIWLGVAWLLAVCMAALSAFDAHPDERFHVAAGAYYLDDWLPPRATEANLAPSLSRYGFTYLGEIDATDFLAGKLASLLPASIPDYLRFRAFNLLLFGILVVVYWRRREPFAPYALLLLTPQIWYVFSYFNNDALPLFLSLLLADLAFGARAPLVAAFSEPLRRATLPPLAGAGILAGLLVLTKSNYLPFLAFVIFFAFWKAFGLAPAAAGIATAGIYLARTRSFLTMSASAFQACLAVGAAATAALVAPLLWRSRATRARVAHGALVALVALAVAGPPLAYDRVINGPGPEKAGALGAIAEKHAVPEYRPSDSADTDSFFGLRLRDKGVALHELLVKPWSWPVKTEQSFTGYYGYMKIRGPAAYYIAIFALYVFLLAYTSRAILLRGELIEKELLVVAAGFGGGVIALSLYHSWINDFQAQGRYLFPVLVLFAIPFTHAARLFQGRVVPALLEIAFFLSSLSFVFVGLRRIAKAFGT
jgi:hypothetical protein